MSFVFGRSSKGKLHTCDARLHDLALRVLEASPIDFAILCGHRNRDSQDEAFASGHSLVQWPNGKHNAMPSRALDFAPVPDPFDERPLALMRYGVIAGIFFAKAHEMGLPIRWGQDWDGDGDLTDQRLNDMGHIELVEG